MLRTGAMRMLMFSLLPVAACAMSRSQEFDLEADSVAAPVVLVPDSNTADGARLVRLGPAADECRAMVECEHNSPPEIGQALLEEDGELLAWLRPGAATDALRLVLPYDDSDCNVACGSLVSSHSTPRGRDSASASGSLPANTPCSTAPGAAHIAIPLPFVDAAEPGEYSVDVRLVDACGASSNPTTLHFEVAPESSSTKRKD